MPYMDGVKIPVLDDQSGCNEREKAFFDAITADFRAAGTNQEPEIKEKEESTD